MQVLGALDVLEVHVADVVDHHVVAVHVAVVRADGLVSLHGEGGLDDAAQTFLNESATGEQRCGTRPCVDANRQGGYGRVRLRRPADVGHLGHGARGGRREPASLGDHLGGERIDLVRREADALQPRHRGDAGFARRTTRKVESLVHARRELEVHVALVGVAADRQTRTLLD